MRLIDADVFRQRLASIAKIFARTDAQRSLMGRCIYCLDKTTTVAEWISVKDRMPTERINENTYDFDWVLCATTFGDVRAYKFGTAPSFKEPHFWDGPGMMDKYVTHWMPLPEPPKEMELE